VKRMGNDEEGEGGPYRPHSASPQVNAFHECVFDCEEKESEKQNLYEGYAESSVGGRRKRCPEVMGMDTQFCAVQANCDVNMMVHADVMETCGQSLNIEQQFGDKLQEACTCMQRALGKSEDDYPCENMMGGQNRLKYL